MSRPSWDEYFMKITELVASRSTCLRRQVGAVLVRNKRILTTGYNGPPAGIEHCDKRGGCLRDELNIPSGERMELSRAIHAEQNAIIQAAKMGISIENSTLYVTTHPCFTCAKMLINAGVKKIIYKEGYPDSFSKGILKEAQVEVKQFNTLLKDYKE
ncbi:cytidine/deoxycytidylate deaminase family protein [candidate division WOR-3 bacterium]|nr:cytidine/deoxycytidylate deaminase family protein [candidate division WOR-3 bacterium]MCK4528662.1 cytidine/deoxycytidylate deaminase family protein [candidate division WOR-3 bacterium]